MPRDSVSYSTKLTPGDTASFFKGFIISQDEVPARLHYHVAGTNFNPVLKAAGDRIWQAQISNNEQVRPSVFTPHQLHVRNTNPLTRNETGNVWVFGVIIICLLLSIIVRVLHYNRLNQLFKAFIKPSFMNQLLREGNIINERITPPLVLLQLLSFSLFIYQAVRLLVGFPAMPYANYVVFILLFAAVSAFYGLKVFLVKTIGWIFQTKESSNIYIINSFIINEICGLFLLPVSIMMYYALPALATITAWTGVVLFIVCFVYMLVRGFMVGLGVRNFSGLYLILYLCTVEFLPVLVLGKLAIDRFFF